MFNGNPDVKFADINLADGGPRGGPGASPGHGGWPTIRYYNKASGLTGNSYEKKTDMAMCSELGPEGGHYMQDYIEEAGSTSLCDVDTLKGCGDKAKKFIAKMREAGAEKIAKEQTRLEGMKEKKMNDDAKAFLSLRLKILKALAKPASGKDEL